MKAQFVYENISFERGSTDKEIKRRLRASGSFKPGEILIRDFPGRPKELVVYVQNDGDTYIAPHKVYSFGTIDRRTGEANFIHYLGNKTGQGNVLTVSLRRANNEEAREILRSLESGKYDKYIEECRKKTGLNPFV